MASVLKVDKLDPQSGPALEIGTSGDTITVPSGATFAVSGTMNASSITAGTVATARLGTGTASSSTVLYGDQTYKAEPGGNNKPYFFVYKVAVTSVANSTWTKIPNATERYDSDGTYDSSTNYRWTPAVAGKYFMYARWRSQGWAATRNMVEIRKNGTAIDVSTTDIEGEDSSSIQTVQTFTIDTATTSDYFEAWAWHNQGGASNILESAFSGWLLIE